MLRLSLIIFSLFLSSTTCFAVQLIVGGGITGQQTVVRVTYSEGGVIGNFKIRLFDELTPETVTNFLNYSNSTTINGGSYDNSFIHRNAKNRFGQNFVLQGGGFSFDQNAGAFEYDSLTDSYTGGLQEVVEDGTIENDFNVSNTRGTIAMAKIGGRFNDADGNPVIGNACTVEGPNCVLIAGTGPDTATSQWFINLKDNADLLDDQNGGFTVFGEVLADSMPIVDGLAATPNFNFESDLDDIPGFAQLPLTNYTAGDAVTDNNLIKINSIEEVFKITSDIEFDDIDINTTSNSTITIENTGNSSFTIGNIADVNSLVAPFSIVQNDCENITLNVASLCDIVIRFAPTVIGDFSDDFNIELDGLSISYSFGVHATSGLLNAPDITANPTTGDFGDVELFDPISGTKKQIVLNIKNDGVDDLVISSLDFQVTSGLSSAFQIINNCTGAFAVLATGESCVIPINFVGTEVGLHSFILTVISNDPDELRLDIPISANAELDFDNVLEAVEDASPNNGDGNFDGLLDSRQSTVVSIPNASGDYFTLMTDNNNISNMVVTDMISFGVLEDGAGVEDGVISFELNNLALGAIVRVGLIVPEGYKLDDYRLLTLDTNTNTSLWSDFVFNAPGAVVVRDAIFTESDGTRSSRDIISIFLEDGGVGDTDLVADGVITSRALLLMQENNSGSGGSTGAFNVLFLFILSMCIVSLRRSKHLQYVKHE